MDVFVDVALLFQIGERFVAPPDWPVMTGELNFQQIAEEVDRFVDLGTPGQRVAHLGTAWRINVVQMVRCDFRHA